MKSAVVKLSTFIVKQSCSQINKGRLVGFRQYKARKSQVSFSPRENS